MTEPVKSTRRYESPRRKAQAAATRMQILESAQKLFEQLGYSGTTMAAVAADAGVALKTVYVAFETKSGLLRALWHLRLRGDTDDLAVQDRRWFHEVIEERDPVRQLRLAASNSRAVKQRVGGLFDVIRSGATIDPEVAALWSRIESDFHDNQNAIVASLAAKGGLRTELDVERGGGHPLDAQSPRHLEPARPRAQLDAGRVGAVVRRHRDRAASSARPPADHPRAAVSGDRAVSRTIRVCRRTTRSRSPSGPRSTRPGCS